MYTILNCSTNHMWNTDSGAEARFYCTGAHLVDYSVFKAGCGGTPILASQV
jgi:hypothetical protein